MNTYNENLQATVDSTLAALASQQAQLASVRIANDYILYFAQEARVSTQQALNDLQAVQQLSLAMAEQGQLNEIAASNLQQSVAVAKADVAVSSSNMATAASNVNIAANAIAALAADIGSALNNTIASLYNTDVHRQVLQVNAFVNEVANDAREVSRLAMEASGKTSEIVSDAVSQQTDGIKAGVDSLFKTTQAVLASVSSQRVGATAAVSQAVLKERQAEGLVLDSARQLEACAEAYRRASAQLNLGLQVQVNSAEEIGVSFNGLPAQVPQFRAVPADDIQVPSANPVYYLTLLPQDQVATFSPEQAQQLFASKTDAQFHKLSSNAGRNTRVALGQDAFGQAIVPGASYVAWLYIELSMEYRRYTGDFSDLLSSPSLPFTPATALPLAQAASGDSLTHEQGTTQYTLHFTATGLRPEPEGLEYRCILVESGARNDLGLLSSPEFRRAPIYFNLDIAEQVAPGNYEPARLESAPKGSRKKAAQAVAADDGDADAQAVVPAAESSTPQQYAVLFDTLTSTDNFGNLLKPGTAYQPYILASVDSDVNDAAAAYTSTLSDALAAITFEDAN